MCVCVFFSLSAATVPFYFNLKKKPFKAQIKQGKSEAASPPPPPPPPPPALVSVGEREMGWHGESTVAMCLLLLCRLYLSSASELLLI